MTGLAEKPVRTGIAWVDELRRRAAERFAEAGLPTTRQEEWRFTNVAPIGRVRWGKAPEVVLPETRFSESIYPPEGETRMAFVNGRPVSGDAGQFGGQLDDFEEVFGTVVGVEQHPFAALNTAQFENTVVLRVPRGTVVEQPIHLVFASSPGMDASATHPRVLIVVGANAQVRITETYLGLDSAGYFTNAVTEIVAGEGAIVDHYKLQMESAQAFHIGNLAVRLGRSVNFSSHSLSLGGALVRNDVSAVLSEGTECTLNGLYLANGTQHVDNHTIIDHAKPHAASHELYKGILDGKASAVFNGKVIVRQDAQKTDAKQTNKNLVLSDEAVIDTKPELQIYADDVKCTHGATIGQLDAESLFYLRSRGIGKAEARNLLTYAFAQDIVDRVQIEPMRRRLEGILFGKFHEHSR